ncbi:rhodanese-like domain-containing protein [Kamptonema cortianum]|nr:rhodanese-like domain-containing protein [Geitlerinema splendidum]MDK3155206.1 rhodanese-like domain-containing protein [Kamptonema cortianum]
MSVPEISVKDLAKKLKAGETPVLLDVREEFELNISKLEGVTHIMDEDVPSRLEELDPDKETVIICRTGRRSLAVAEYLISKGFTQVFNLEGGMNAWAERVDPSMPVY